MTQQILSGILLDEQIELTLSDLCRVCATSAEWVIELVEEGVLEPVVPVVYKQTQTEQTQWRFSADSLQKARTAMRLQRDLGINLAGVALALDLLDEINSLEARLRRLEVNDQN